MITGPAHAGSGRTHRTCGIRPYNRPNPRQSLEQQQAKVEQNTHDDAAVIARGPHGVLESRRPPPPALADDTFIATEHASFANERQFVLKAGNTFVVNDANGDIRGKGRRPVRHDTRVLSQLYLTFGGRAPSLLSGSVSSDNAVFTAHLTNRPLPPIGARRRQRA